MCFDLRPLQYTPSRELGLNRQNRMPAIYQIKGGIPSWLVDRDTVSKEYSIQVPQPFAASIRHLCKYLNQISVPTLNYAISLTVVSRDLNLFNTVLLQKVLNYPFILLSAINYNTPEDAISVYDLPKEVYNYLRGTIIERFRFHPACKVISKYNQYLKPIVAWKLRNIDSDLSPDSTNPGRKYSFFSLIGTTMLTATVYLYELMYIFKQIFLLKAVDNLSVGALNTLIAEGGIYSVHDINLILMVLYDKYRRLVLAMDFEQLAVADAVCKSIPFEQEELSRR
jgi:hypothetical protein